MKPVTEITNFNSLHFKIQHPFFSYSTTKLPNFHQSSIKSQKSPQTPNPQFKKHKTQHNNPIPINSVKTLAKFRSKLNHIHVLQLPENSDHPFAGSRLLLLDDNIHSITPILKSLTNTYLDVFATLPPILPPGPIGILGFGAGSAARLVLELYPEAIIHGWEIDPAVISISRKYFGVSKLEKDCPNRLFVYVGNALNAEEVEVKNGFSGLLVDLFSKGRLIPELRDLDTWVKMKTRLRENGRIMVNVGGECVGEDGRLIMEETLEAMHKVFDNEVLVLKMENVKGDGTIALTGKMPNVEEWKKGLDKSLRVYVDMWEPFTS